MSHLFINHIAGFLMTRLIYSFQFNNPKLNAESVNISAKTDKETSLKTDLQVQDYEPTNKFADLLERQVETLESINDNVSNPRKDSHGEEWKALARVIDRLCLLLFSLLQFCGILILLCGTAYRAT